MTSLCSMEKHVSCLLAAFEHAPVGVAVIAVGGACLGSNRAMEELTGYATEALGECAGLCDPIRGEPACSAERRITRADGELRWVRVSRVPVPGRGLEALVLVEDIERQRRMEELAFQAQRLDTIGRMAAGIAHDFNNLLAVMLSYADGLTHDQTLGEEQRADAGEILATARRAAALSAQLLTLARRQPTRVCRVELPSLFQTLERMLTQIVGTRIALSWHVEEGTPACLADPMLLDQVLVNLVVNARDAMPTGGALAIRARLVVLDDANSHGLPPGPFVAIDVEDSGQGMPAELLGRIFEPFFTTKGARGTGLGLATVLSIARQSGGTVTVRSAVGRGTCFTVFLPPSQSGVQLAEGTHWTEEQLDTQPVGHAHLLVVEDDPSVRRVLHTMLSRAGYQVTLATNGAEALFLASQPEAHFDALITDIDLPLLGGIGLADRLGALAPMPTLFVSALPERLVQLGRSVPALAKPFQREELLAAVGKLVQG